MSVTHFEDILTPRLALIAITPEMLDSERSEDGRLKDRIGCTIPGNWPPEHWEPHVFDLLLAQYALCPWQIAWHRYIALRNNDGSRSLIGAIGSFWREAAPAEGEIGYSVLPPHEGKGFATEAARALIELIRTDKRITSVIAHTFPRLSGSVRGHGEVWVCVRGTRGGAGDGAIPTQPAKSGSVNGSATPLR